MTCERLTGGETRLRYHGQGSWRVAVGVAVLQCRILVDAGDVAGVDDADVADVDVIKVARTDAISGEVDFAGSQRQPPDPRASARPVHPGHQCRSIGCTAARWGGHPTPALAYIGPATVVK